MTQTRKVDHAPAGLAARRAAWRRPMMIALLAAAGLAAPFGAVAPAANPLYEDLGRAGTGLDLAQARAVFSAYRLNAGLGPLALDAALVLLAQAEADTMARADRPGSAEALKRRLRTAGIDAAEVNLSAGYRTLAQAFSGWRDSPPHQKVLRAANGRRMGLAIARAPGSKYAVYWALIIAP